MPRRGPQVKHTTTGPREVHIFCSLHAPFLFYMVGMSRSVSGSVSAPLFDNSSVNRHGKVSPTHWCCTSTAHLCSAALQTHHGPLRTVSGIHTPLSGGPPTQCYGTSPPCVPVGVCHDMALSNTTRHNPQPALVYDCHSLAAIEQSSLGVWAARSPPIHPACFFERGLI